MIKKLQIKFIVIIMTIMTVVLLCIFGAINITMHRSTDMQTLGIMKRIADSDGQMRRGEKPELNDKLPKITAGLVSQTNFSLKLDHMGNIIEVISDRNQNYTEEEVAQHLKNALGSGENYGNTEGLQFFIREKPYGKIVVFLDNTIETNGTTRLLWITLIVGLTSLIVIFFVSLYLSSWAIKPVKKAYEAQKRFVADASHELKTPLTVISANVDVLSSDFENNKWLGFIKAETVRMGELVNNLLYLAKSDASENTYNMIEFDLSDAITNVVLPFESSCYESHKKLTLNVGENILYKGDELRLSQVVVILLDNAIKNTKDNGEIIVSLTQQNGKKNISVYNTGEGLSDEDKNKIFDRFYRGDSSRARQTGGYGLGLSIAKTIVDAHKGKIVTGSEKGKGVKFTVVL